MAECQKLQTIDLFCGAGGLSTGFSHEGFDIVAPVDNNEEVIETFTHNHESTALKCDIEDDSVVDRICDVILENEGDPRDIDLVVGGPPCKGFSQANVQTRHDDNPLNDLPGRFLDIVESFSPSAVVMENVPKILTMSDGKYKEAIVNRMEDMGFNIKTVILKAEEFGVPQLRRRAFFIAVQEGKPPIPLATHSDEDPSLPDPIPVKDAIFDLPRLPDGGGGSSTMDYDPREEYITDYVKDMRSDIDNGLLYNHRTTVNKKKTAKRFKYVDPGNNWRQIPEELMSNYKDRSRTHDHIYRRLVPDQPAFTVANFRKQMMIHPEKHNPGEFHSEDQNRLLSIREAARLQSFPDDYVFPSKSITKKQQMVGNAVPVRLAESIAKSLKIWFSNHKTDSSQIKA